MKSKLFRNLKEDEEDEDEAIESYGERQKEAKNLPVFKSMLKHIQSEEKEHKSKLGKMTAGPSKATAKKMIKKRASKK